MTAMYESGQPAVAFDKQYYTDDTEDITTSRGFNRALRLVLRLKCGASLWAAPVCSSWGFVGRSTTKRSRWNPRGCRFNHRVLHANSMVVIVTMLFMLAYTRGVHCWLEQPTSSLMASISPMTEFLKVAMPHRQTVWLGAFGASSQKPLLVWCTSPVVTLLARPKPVHCKQRLCRKVKGRYYGKKADLTGSSAYPAAFGRAVARLMIGLSCG